MGSPVKVRDFEHDDEVLALVRAFEACEVQEFPHCAHIAVALSYLATLSPPRALQRMRRSLLRFTRLKGVDVYHETITCFWMKLLQHLATTHYRSVPLWRRINLIVKRWPPADPIAAHYSGRLIRSHAARESWVAPDRLPLPF